MNYAVSLIYSDALSKKVKIYNTLVIVPNADNEKQAKRIAKKMANKSLSNIEGRLIFEFSTIVEIKNN